MSEEHLPRFAKARLAELEEIAEELRKRLRKKSREDHSESIRTLLKTARELQHRALDKHTSA